MLGTGQIFRDPVVMQVIAGITGDLTDAYSLMEKAEGSDNAATALESFDVLK